MLTEKKFNLVLAPQVGSHDVVPQIQVNLLLEGLRSSGKRKVITVADDVLELPLPSLSFAP